MCTRSLAPLHASPVMLCACTFPPASSHLSAHFSMCRATELIPVPWTIHMYNPVYMLVTDAKNVAITSPPEVVSGYIDGTLNPGLGSRS